MLGVYKNWAVVLKSQDLTWSGRRWKTLDSCWTCSSWSVPGTSSWLDSRRNSELENLKVMVRICFLSSLSSMGWRMWYGHVRVYWSEWSHSCCDVGNCHSLFLSTGVFIISFGYCTGESSLFFLVGLIVIVKGLYTLVACDLHNIWAFNIYFL